MAPIFNVWNILQSYIHPCLSSRQSLKCTSSILFTQLLDVCSIRGVAKNDMWRSWLNLLLIESWAGKAATRNCLLIKVWNVQCANGRGSSSMEFKHVCGQSNEQRKNEQATHHQQQDETTSSQTSQHTQRGRLSPFRRSNFGTYKRRWLHDDKMGLVRHLAACGLGRLKEMCCDWCTDDWRLFSRRMKLIKRLTLTWQSRTLTLLFVAQLWFHCHTMNDGYWHPHSSSIGKVKASMNRPRQLHPRIILTS